VVFYFVAYMNKILLNWLHWYCRCDYNNIVVNQEINTMSKLVVYDPVYGGLFLKSDQYDAVRRGVQEAVGEAVFKMGYSEFAPDGATKALRNAYKANGIEPVVPQGVITQIGVSETSDQMGNSYKKVRVTIKRESDELLLSIDFGSQGDVAKRLISKLANYQSGVGVKISAWAFLEHKENRTYVNHSVSIKTVEGQEVPAKQGLFAQAKESAENIIRVANFTDKKVIDALKKSEQEKLFLRELQEAAERLLAAPEA
jgi:hypothetical protein